MDRRARTRNLAALGAVAALLVAGLGWMALRPVTEEAPTFALAAVPDLDDGAQGLRDGNATDRVLDLGAMRGKVVVLDLMAVNCAACRTLTEQVLHPVWDKHGGSGDVALWSIDVWAGLPGQVGETEEDLQELRRDEGSVWPHALDNGSVYESYRPVALPQVLVVDRDGRIVFHASAPDLPSLESVERAIGRAQAGGSAAVGLPRSGLGALAAMAGAAAVLSPCSIGLLPAYFGMLLRGRSARPGPVLGGLQTSAGVVLAYAAIALLLLPFGNAILPHVPKLGIAMGLLFVVLGALMLAGFDWGRLTRGLRRDRFVPDGGNRGYWAFGVGYALASFGCTGPIFLPLLFSAFGAGPLVGTTVFLLYAVGVALLLVLIALLAALGADGPLRWVTANSVWVSRVVAAVWILAGLYLVFYDLRAYGDIPGLG